jgi:acetolactate synthase-1/2/3 large subunit
VSTTLEGKSAFPETNPLSLGTGAGVMPRPVYEFLNDADVIFAIGASLTRYSLVATSIPAGKTIIHATNDHRDINKDYVVDYPILGDAKLVLRQFIAAVKDIHGAKNRDTNVTSKITQIRESWLSEWMPKLTSKEVPINPYRVFWEFMRTVDPRGAIITHDSGGPRNELVPFYQAPTPHSFIGWGKSHALGAGLGLIMGAKLAAPDKFCVNFMGDAAFGMTGLDFETAVRSNIPILTVVLNNNFMAGETNHLPIAHKLHGILNVGGNYADIGRALGGWAERVENPEEIAPAIQRARKATEGGKAALLDFITSREHQYSR